MITQERLKEHCTYWPITGQFTRNHSSDKFKAGSVCGCLNRDGYWLIEIDGRKYFAQRLAFLYMLGRWPDPEADHENRVRSDNSWANLREASRQEQNWNRSVNHTSTTGMKGVRPAPNGKFQARIWVDGRRKSLGYFDSKDVAAAAYAQAEYERSQC